MSNNKNTENVIAVALGALIDEHRRAENIIRANSSKENSDDFLESATAKIEILEAKERFYAIAEAVLIRCQNNEDVLKWANCWKSDIQAGSEA